MKRPVMLVIALAALSAVLAAGALAALPKKGGLYEGTLYASGTAALTKQVRIKVARDREDGPRDLVVRNRAGTEHAPVRDQAGRDVQGVQQHGVADRVVLHRAIRIADEGSSRPAPQRHL